MTIDRRRLLAAGIGGGLLASLSVPVLAKAGAEPMLLSAYGTAGGGEMRFGVAGMTRGGELLFTTALPGRAHAVVPSPTRAEAVVFARRPGTWFAPLDLASGKLGATVTVPDDRRVTGHGAFSPDGTILYAAEDDVPGEVGAVGVYDARDGYRRVGGFPAHGVGPHELIAMDQGRVLVIANGGVITNPETGRAKLNVDQVEASVTYVEAATGRLLEKVALPPAFSNLGLRHVVELPDGGIAFGVQDERPTGELQPVVWTHRRGQAPVPLEAPEDALAGFDGYIGAIAATGGTIAASSPRGGQVGLWDARSGAWLGAVPLPDGCGLTTAEDGGYWMSNGFGTVAELAPRSTDEEASRSTPGYRWDNHLAWVAG